jgi:hypothetical protein
MMMVTTKPTSSAVAPRPQTPPAPRVDDVLELFLALDRSDDERLARAYEDACAAWVRAQTA